MIVDNFMDNFDWLRAYCDRLDYSDTVNPADGVSYPGISLMIPPSIGAEIIYKAQQIIDKPIASVTQFLRLTCDDVEIPHQAHTDALMADVVVLLYLNRDEHCQGGTELVRHIETGLDCNPASDHELEVWQRDTNEHEAWESIYQAEMKPNRALVIDASKMHRPVTPTGFGGGAEDGRLVLTTFIKVAA